MEYKILGSKWWTPPVPGNVIGSNLCIGVVAIESHNPNNGEPVQWKCYVGFGLSNDESSDEQRIASRGVPIGGKEAACGLFPELSPEGFRY